MSRWTEIAKYSPSVIAECTEIAPDLLRNMRARGMLDNYGEVDANGRHLYSAVDLVGFYISRRLSDRGRAMGREEALRLGQVAAPDVINAFFHFKHDGNRKPPRFLAIHLKGSVKSGEVFGSSLIPIADIEDLASLEPFDELRLIDLWHLAQTLPAKIEGTLYVARHVAEAEE